MKGSSTKYSPIIIFAFNRIDTFRQLVDTLKACPESSESDLYIYVDGPRDESATDLAEIGMVREYAARITGFKSLTLSFSKHNRGLGPSIIAGVSAVLKQHDSAIILEDDLQLSPKFLTFMNHGMKRYRDCNSVFSICGYTNKIKIPEGYPYDAYFCTRSSSWGWGTWADRWNSVDWELTDWDHWKKYRRSFNRWGGSDCFGMLDSWKRGLNKSWAIRFCFAQFLQDKVSLFPIKSLVVNDGFDGNGTNCKKWSRFKYELMPPDRHDFRLPSSTDIDRRLTKQAMAYNGLLIRIWSKIMYILHR